MLYWFLLVVHAMLFFHLIHHYQYVLQEYTIYLYKEDDKSPIATLSIFSAKQDLYELTPVKSDFHSHTFRSDGARDPAAAAGYYREQGYDCYALTDHNRFYPGGEIDETYEGVDTEFFRIKGEEVHAPGSVIHIVHVGGKESVAARYIEDTDGFMRETDEYLARVPKEVPAEFALRYAKAMWVCDHIHAAGGLAIFPHPFWRPSKSKLHNVTAEYARLLLNSGMFDAYELVGGMGLIGNVESVALWGDLRAEGLKIPIVGSSDVHKFEKSIYFPHLYTSCFAKERTADGVVGAIKDGMTVAVQDQGYEYDRQYHVFGSYRLVVYANFLLKNYFLPMQRIAQGEGVAMREFAIGRADRALIELYAKQAREFRLAFFGKKMPALPTKEMLDWEEKWRDVQRSGPQTKGSSLTSAVPTMQI